MTSPNRTAINGSIRNRHELHSARCRCTSDSPLAAQIEALRTENLILRNRIQDGQTRLIDSRVRFVENENRKLEEKINNYQKVMSELESTHMQLVNMVKASQNIAQLNSKGNKNQLNPSTSIFEGDYLISLKKLTVNVQNDHGSQERQMKQDEQTAVKKPGYNDKTPKYRKNQQVQSPKTGQKSKSQDLIKAQIKIKQLQGELQQKTKLKSAFKSIQNQNELLRQKIKMIEINLKSYQDSIRHYQSEVSKSKKQISQLKSKQSTSSIAARQNSSLKDSNEYMRKQIQDVQAELQKERQTNLRLRDEVEIQNKKNIKLIEQCNKLTIFAEQIEKQKKTILLLNQELQNKSIQLFKQQEKVKKYKDISKQMFEIKQSLEQVDLSTVEQEQRKIILEHRQKYILLNQQISSLNSQVEKYKQQILVLQQKTSTMSMNQKIMNNSLEQAEKYKSILLEQIKNLSSSIDKYLQKQEQLPVLKIIDEDNKQIQNKGKLTEIKDNIDQIIQRLGTLENKLHKTD